MDSFMCAYVSALHPSSFGGRRSTLEIELDAMRDDYFAAYPVPGGPSLLARLTTGVAKIAAQFSPELSAGRVAH
jgi:hypothetical protein